MATRTRKPKFTLRQNGKMMTTINLVHSLTISQEDYEYFEKMAIAIGKKSLNEYLKDELSELDLLTKLADRFNYNNGTA